MTLPDSLRFDPVPLKARHDGWTVDLQTRFIVALARGLGVAGAARAVGKARATAYALRTKPGAGSFVAAWEGALAHARRRCPQIVRTVSMPAPFSRAERLRSFAGGRPLSADRLFAGLDARTPERPEQAKADALVKADSRPAGVRTL